MFYNPQPSQYDAGFQSMVDQAGAPQQEMCLIDNNDDVSDGWFPDLRDDLFRTSRISLTLSRGMVNTTLVLGSILISGGENWRSTEFLRW